MFLFEPFDANELPLWELAFLDKSKRAREQEFVSSAVGKVGNDFILNKINFLWDMVDKEKTLNEINSKKLNKALYIKEAYAHLGLERKDCVGALFRFSDPQKNLLQNNIFFFLFTHDPGSVT